MVKCKYKLIFFYLFLPKNDTDCFDVDWIGSAPLHGASPSAGANHLAPPPALGVRVERRERQTLGRGR